MNIDSLSKILKMTGANDSLKIRHQTDRFRKKTTWGTWNGAKMTIEIVDFPIKKREFP
jgi:hypothetical protein